MVSKDVLQVDNPRDAFALMLLERIDALENKIYNIERRLDNAERVVERVDAELSNATDYKVKRSNNFVCFGSVSSSFFIKVVKPVTVSLQQFKHSCVDILHQVQQKLGIDAFMTLTLVLGSRDGTITCADIYFNMKDRCFIYLIFKLLSTIQYPFPVNAKCDMIDIYLLHINHGRMGEYYSLYSVNGEAIEFPEWKEWTDTLELCVMNPEPSD